MPYIKELVIHGFKSFARETRIPFKNTMNVIVGPNGSGKSNVTDAICFVLGRLGSKSMRAKRLGNLLFAGTDKYKPSSEASVEMIFDNSDKGFSIDKKEISIKRVLKRGGQGTYKIDNEVKTRQEVLELLAQAGIDPNGFNIVLQGEIDSFVKMPPIERREVIEEVAGISIYEIRKQRSLKELERTEQKLKEVGAILRERTIYLKNLEQERKQALKFKRFQQEVKDCKASILYKTVQEKQEKIDIVNKEIKGYQSDIAKLNELMEKNSQEISVLNGKIANITDNIQKQSGLQQEKLNNEITDLRADLAGLSIRKESSESQIFEMKSRKAELTEDIKRDEQEIEETNKSKSKGKTPETKKELDIKKSQIEEIENKKRELYILKSNLSTLDSRVEDKKRDIQKNKIESDSTLNRIREMESLIKIKEDVEKQRDAVGRIKIVFDKLKKEQIEAGEVKSEKEKNNAVLEMQIKELGKIKEKISSFDLCPLCKTKMTKEHVSKVVDETNEQKANYDGEIKKGIKTIAESEEKIKSIINELEKAEQELNTRGQDILRLELIKEKKDTLRRFTAEQKELEEELEVLQSKKSSLEKKVIGLKTSEANYDNLRLEIQELERRQEKDVGLDLTLKQRGVERMKNTIRQAQREIDELENNLDEIKEQLEQKQDSLNEKNEQDQMLKRKFQKILAEKSQYQEKIRYYESDSLSKQNNKMIVDEKINNLKIQRAEFDAQRQTAEQEKNEFKEVKILRLSIPQLKEKIEQSQRIIDSIGNVNMRSLEVYEDTRKQYEQIQEKTEVLVREKQEIMNIIEDIDKKKRKVFSQTLKDINALFSRNFSQLSSKGEATLNPVDKEDIFKDGIEMLIKVGKGKYFDTHSLSGGEKSLVSLALIFAIQEYKPYCFYIFDEIDAALDRRNSERLANLLKRYMKVGQYIVITHNDSLITESPTIYGVSMQDKISNILSLEV